MAVLSVKTVGNLMDIFKEKYYSVWRVYQDAKPGSIVMVSVDSYEECKDLRDAVEDAKLTRLYSHDERQVWIQKPKRKW